MNNINEVKKIFKQTKVNLISWSRENFLGLVVFNILIMSLVMLRSAGYFAPYLYITINSIVILGLVIVSAVLRASSKAVFFIALLFLGFSCFLRILRVDIWAERSSIYAFDALIIGFILLLFEARFTKKNNSL